MDPSLYEAVQEGNLNAIREKKELVSTTQLTPNKNTVLHVAAQFDNSMEFALEILKIDGSLLCEVNSDGETALHVAARNGNKDVGEQMMRFAKSLDEDPEAGGRGGALKKLLSCRNRNGDTALHEAIRNNRPSMVDLMTKEDPDIANIANNELETPLFLAVDIVQGYENWIMSVNYILENCPSPAYTGPNGKTALHAAASYNQKQISENLLAKYPTVIMEVDDCGWSALHYAALCGSNEVAEKLLKADKSIAYIAAEKDNDKTALHIATCRGKVNEIEEILAYCPDCWEMVTGDGQNILHLSVKFEQREAFNFIMKKSWVGNLINQKDAEGNTPLHVYASTPLFRGRDLVNHPRAETNALNKKHMTPLDVIRFSNVHSLGKRSVIRELKAKGAISQNSLLLKKEGYLEKKDVAPMNIRKAANTHLLVATLITTVAFAAGFTIPGGYDGNDGPNEGLAILSRKAAFKAFIITDSLAMVCSASAVFLYVIGAISHNKLQRALWYSSASELVIVAMGAMVIAFMTGLYTVLEHSRELAIIECVICSFCLPFFYLLKNIHLKDFLNDL